MVQSRIIHFCIKLTICILFLGKQVDTQVNISAATNPINGDTINLTCIISVFTLPALWKNNDNGAHITTCFNSGTCSPPSDGVRYTFSATASSIIVTISRFNSTIDTFTWKCEYSGIVAVYRIMATNTNTQVNIPDITNAINGDTVNLTCIISAFTLPALWKNNDNGAHITTCFNFGTCSPPSDGVRYTFSATASSIIVTISRFNSTIDTFTWKCEYSGIVAVYRIMATNTTPSTAVTTAANTMVTPDPNAAVTPDLSTAVISAAYTTGTPIPNTAVTTATNKTVMTLAVTSAQSQNALIIGVTVGGSVVILIIIIIICCCCKCCYL